MYDQYGNEFVSKVNSGGEFVGLYEFHTTSAAERESLSVAIDAAVGSVGRFETHAEFSSAMSSIRTETRSTMTVFIEGGRGKLPEFSPDAVLEFAQVFPEAVDPEHGDPVILDSTLTSYKKAGYHPKPEPPFAENKRLLDGLATVHGLAATGRNDLDLHLKTPEAMKKAGLAAEPMEKAYEALKTMMRDIEDRARRLMDEPWHEEDPVGPDARELEQTIDRILKVLPDPGEPPLVQRGGTHVTVKHQKIKSDSNYLEFIGTARVTFPVPTVTLDVGWVASIV